MMKSLTLAASLMLCTLAHAGETLSISQWQADVRAALQANNTKAFEKLTNFKALAKAVTGHSSSADRELMEAARAQFAKGDFDGALATYDKVPKTSDFWLEAVEEKGWALNRQSQFEKAIAQTKTLLTPAFVSVVGTEPFFLKSLSALKICDYKEVLQTTKLFKETQRERVIAIQNLAKTGETQTIEALFTKATRFPLEITMFGEEAKSLPRLFFRDSKLQKALLASQLAQALEASKLGDGATPQMSELRLTALAKLENEASKARATVAARLKALAADEADENFKLVQKLNLVEVETIQRLHHDLSLDQNTFAKGKFRTVSMDELSFPDDGHPWMDEVDKYEVKADKCPQDIRRKM